MQLIPKIKEFIETADLAQLKKMQKELSRELNLEILQDNKEHSYTLEL